MIEPENVDVGRLVVFRPTPEMAFRGFIDCEARQLRWGAWVVRLRRMEPAYALAMNLPPGTDTVEVAALDCCEYPMDMAPSPDESRSATTIGIHDIPPDLAKRIVHTINGTLEAKP